MDKRGQGLHPGSTGESTNVTPISGPVPMRAGGLIMPLFIAGGLPGAYAFGEANSVTLLFTRPFTGQSMPLLLVAIRRV